MIEEVARPVLDRIPHTMPLRRHVRGRLSKQQRLRVVEDVLVGAGVSEAYTWSLVGSDPNPDAIRLRNPMTSDQASFGRRSFPGSSRRPSHRESTRAPTTSRSSRSHASTCRPANSPDERWRVAGVVAGGYDVVKGVLETLYAALHPSFGSNAGRTRLHPGKAAATEAGWLGELHPTLLEGAWGRSSSTWTPCSHPCPSGSSTRTCSRSPRCSRTSRSPAEDVEVGALAAHEAAGALLREARVFDVYRGEQVGEGRKSVAIHLSFQSPERTLTDDEAEARARIVAALADRFDAELRA